MLQDPVPQIAEERPPAIASIVDNPAHAVIELLRVYPSASYYSIALRIFGLNLEAYQTSSQLHKDIVWHTLLDLEDIGLIVLHRLGTIFRADGVEEPLISSAEEAYHRYTPRYTRSKEPCNEVYEENKRTRKKKDPQDAIE